jgi:hypothetical protein
VERSCRISDRTDRRRERRKILRRRAILSLTVPPHLDNMPVLVFDISCKGVGFVADVPLEPGTEVSLAWEHGPKRRHRTVAARVTHASMNDDGAWRVGCTFTLPLEPRDLQAFLKYCARL